MSSRIGTATIHGASIVQNSQQRERKKYEDEENPAGDWVRANIFQRVTYRNGIREERKYRPRVSLSAPIRTKIFLALLFTDLFLAQLFACVKTKKGFQDRNAKQKDKKKPFIKRFTRKK